MICDILLYSLKEDAYGYKANKKFATIKILSIETYEDYNSLLVHIAVYQSKKNKQKRNSKEKKSKKKAETPQENTAAVFTEEEKVVEFISDILEDIYIWIECIESLNAPQLKAILVYHY